jgi:hypothetical protein
MARKVRTTVVGAALVLAGLLAGLLSAQALGEVGVPGVTTVGLPTVPLPVPTTPPAPPVPAPPPAPPTTPSPAVPTVPGVPAPGPPSTPPVTVSPSPASAQSSERSTGPARSSFSSGRSAERREPAAANSKARVTRIRARSNRVTRGKHRKAARITFTLSAPARVVFVVRGPAPSCGVAGRFSVRGRRGVNHVRFRGRVGRRNLPYGKYRITARTRGRAPSRAIVVVVGERAAAEAFACNPSRPSSDAFASVFGTFSSGGSGRAAAGASGMGKDTAAGKRQEAKDKPDSGVLPAVTKRLKKLPDALPKPSIPGASASPPWILGIGALALLALSALALLVYVLRYLRRFRTTQA